MDSVENGIHPYSSPLLEKSLTLRTMGAIIFHLPLPTLKKFHSLPLVSSVSQNSLQRSSLPLKSLSQISTIKLVSLTSYKGISDSKNQYQLHWPKTITRSKKYSTIILIFQCVTMTSMQNVAWSTFHSYWYSVSFVYNLTPRGGYIFQKFSGGYIQIFSGQGGYTPLPPIPDPGVTVAQLELSSSNIQINS